MSSQRVGDFVPVDGPRRADRHHPRPRRRAARLLQRVPPSGRAGGADARATASRCSAATTAGPTAWTARCARARRWRRRRTSARRTSAWCRCEWRRWGPFVFVNLDASAPPLAEVMGAIPAEVARAGYDVDHMRLVERRDYVIECNWKVYVDNYLEGYHLPIAHPQLFKELDYDTYRVEEFRYYSKQHAPIRELKPGEELGRRSALPAPARRPRTRPSTTGSSRTPCSTSTRTTCPRT